MRESRCAVCGESMFVDSDEVSYHGTSDSIEHDRDADHVAIDEREYEAAIDALRQGDEGLKPVQLLERLPALPPGWRPLAKHLAASLDPGTEVADIKSKMGSLAIYLDGVAVSSVEMRTCVREAGLATPVRPAGEAMRCCVSVWSASW